MSRQHLKGRLLAAGLKANRCESCGIKDRLENLMLLCPNCHSQTENFSGRNRRRPAA